MSALLQSLVRRFLPGRGCRTPEVHLAAFGKHPGWNDHIDDIGLETKELVDLKRILYVEGVAGNIDAGAWDSLPEEQRLPAFEHLFLWKTEQRVVVGRIWSSRDGKGRTRYPMIVCAECCGLPLGWVLSHVLPRLAGIEQACRDTTDASAVVSVIERVRQELRGQAAPTPAPATGGAGGSPPAADGGQDPLAALSRHPDMGQDANGLLLVLYQIEREMAPFRSSRADRFATTGPRHLRVPACAESPEHALALWHRFLDGQLNPLAPVWIILPLEAKWVDLIVGNPTAAQLFCIRARPSKIPLTTEIPYTLDEAFISHSRELISAATGH